MGSPEHDLQLVVTRFLSVALPPDVVWTAVDHGAGKMTPRSAGQRKARGVKPGQADYRFVIPPHGRSGEIELKAAKGRQRPEQKSWQADVEAAGGLYRICRSLDEVTQALMDWGVPLRARIVS